MSLSDEGYDIDIDDIEKRAKAMRSLLLSPTHRAETKDRQILMAWNLVRTLDALGKKELALKVLEAILWTKLTERS